MRISDWSSDVCSSDLQLLRNARSGRIGLLVPARSLLTDEGTRVARFELVRPLKHGHITADQLEESNWRSEEHTSELQSLMRISYAVFCLKKNKHTIPSKTSH